MASHLFTSTNRKERMSVNVQCVDALTNSARTPITRTINVLSKVLFNLEENGGRSVSPSMLQSLRIICNEQGDTSIDSIALQHYAKTFLLFLEGLEERCSPSTDNAIPAYLKALVNVSSSDDAHIRPSKDIPSSSSIAFPSSPPTIKTEYDDATRTLFGEYGYAEGEYEEEYTGEEGEREQQPLFPCIKCAQLFHNKESVLRHVRACEGQVNKEKALQNVIMRSQRTKGHPKAAAISPSTSSSCEKTKGGWPRKKPQHFTCSQCRKDFLSRVGAKYHATKVCFGARMIPRRQTSQGSSMEGEEEDPIENSINSLLASE